MKKALYLYHLKHYISCIGIIFLIGLSYSLFGQQNMLAEDVFVTIPEIALVDVEPDYNAIPLTFVVPTEAGLPLLSSAVSTDASKWLNYTSAVAPGETRNISVQITNGALPNGLDLRLLASNYSGSGSGTHGISTGEISLNTTAQTIISGIGGAFTGDGASNGHQLSYILLIDNYQGLNFDANNTIEVMFTITD